MPPSIDGAGGLPPFWPLLPSRPVPWGASPPPLPPETGKSRGGSGAAVFGLILVIVGVWVLFGDQLDIDLDFSEVWPVAAVILGVVMVVASVLPGRGERQD